MCSWPDCPGEPTEENPGGSCLHGNAKDESLHELVEVRLRRIDQRYTPGRRAMVELSRSLGHPVSISSTSPCGFRTFRGVRPTATSSTCKVRASCGELPPAMSWQRIELAEDLTEHHHHLLCTICGRVNDVTPTQAFERMVAKMVRKI